MKENYHYKEVENTSQNDWQINNSYLAIDNNISQKKFFACSMLPYPSGKLHMGHVRNYTINDVMNRYKRMLGFNVLMPMGWDAFGMPAENAAIKSKVSPAKWTYSNIEYMKMQMKQLGLSIDWSREICACDPQYYKWNQWFFLKMLEKGIAYRKTQIVNWDPVDKTVLANEQVIDGRGWRSGALIEQREIPGYYLKITQYAEEFLDEMDKALSGWPDKVLSMQKNWIGKSEGLRFAFTHSIKDENNKLIQNGRLYVFTTRPDTLMGVTFCVIAPEHPLSIYLSKSNCKIKDFIKICQSGLNTEESLSTREKKGINTGLTINHPITKEPIDLWIGNYVLMNYGDGAVMGVPAHDERDFQFAKKYGIKIKQVLHNINRVWNKDYWQDWYSDKNNTYLINSNEFNNLSSYEAVDAISKKMIDLNLGAKLIKWRLRDWGISRQRYWGTPIPIIHCNICGEVPVPEKDLPVILPENLIPDGSGNPLNKNKDFLNCFCPKCNGPAKRETDTMDTFVDSSWYFMRYTSPNCNDFIIDSRKNEYWMPMDHYIGGVEHSILHLLYARFWTKVMRDFGLVKFNEPFQNLLCQGMVLNHAYSRTNKNGSIEYFNPNDIKNIYDDNGSIVSSIYKLDNLPVDHLGMTTMSKSKNNGVDPQSIIELWGADTVRMFIMFASPPEQTLEWSENGIEGSYKFLNKLWKLCYQRKDYIKNYFDGNYNDIKSNLSDNSKNLRREVYKLLKQINYDYERQQYNTVISSSMKLVKNIENFNDDCPIIITEVISILIRVLYPIVPHITYKLWNDLGYCSYFGNLLDAQWPDIDEEALKSEKIELIIQINGKLRGKILVSSNDDVEKIKNIASNNSIVLKFLKNKPIKNIIVVENKLVNIVA